MLNRLSQFFVRISSGWVTLLATLIFILFTALVLPGQASKAEQAAQGAGAPDTTFTYYSAATLYDWAEAYGEIGRQAYVQARFTFDLAWPAVYFAFLVTAISWLYSRGFPPGSRWRLANLAPVAAVLFDLLENISTSLVMARYPAPTPGFDALAGVFTLVKWVFVLGSFLLLLVGVFAALRPKKPTPSPSGRGLG